MSQRSEVKNTLMYRVMVVIGLISLLYIIITIRLFHLKVVEREYWESKANVIKEKDILPKRGSIYSCNGALMAASIPYYDMRIDFSKNVIHDTTFNNNIDELTRNLSDFFKDESKSEYKRIFKKQRAKGSRYFLLHKNLSFWEMETIKKFPMFEKGQFKGGLIIEKREKRVLPQKRLAHRTIGYKNEETVPVGIEGAFDAQLSGFKGKQLMQKVSGNKWIPIDETKEIEPTPGIDVISTIDMRFQDITDQYLEKQLKKNNASHGVVIVMEVATGEIKAITNLKNTSEEDYYEIKNDAIGENHEPGSTIKLASMMALFEDSHIQLNDSINTLNGEYKFYDRVMRDSRKGGHGILSIKDVLAYSSNVGIARLINDFYQNDPSKFISRLHSFGISEKTGVEIMGEQSPKILDPKSSEWSGISLPWMSIGYGIKLSPLQTLNLYNTVANNGVMMKPHLVKALSKEGKITRTFAPTVMRSSICSQHTIENLQVALKAVTEYGTGRSLNKCEFKIAGKTGTAQLANRKHGYRNEAEEKSYLASFAGYFPADNPKYSAIVVIHSPKKQGYYATQVAVPVFKNIAERIYALEFKKDIEYDFESENKIALNKGKEEDYYHLCKILNPEQTIEKNNQWVKATYQSDRIATSSIHIEENTVPNFIGMGLKDALNLVELQGLRLRIRGAGKVVNQSIKAGQLITNNNQIIYLDLK